MRRALPIVLGALLMAGFFASNAAAPTFNVTVGPVGQLRYSPDPQTINVNDTVHWIWGSGNHSTTSGPCNPTCTPDGKWSSGIRNSGATFDHTFTTAGNYPYFCTAHVPDMKGTIIVNGPTGVQFTSFAAVRTARGIRVSWRTGSELKTLGFHVYRERAGKMVRLTSRLIAARGEIRSASYSFLDRTAGRPAVYWLRVVETDGSRTWFGRAVA